MIKSLGDFEEGVNSHALAHVFAEVLNDLEPDLILTGVQAHTNLEGAVGSLLASTLDMPYVGYVAGLDSDGLRANLIRIYLRSRRGAELQLHQWCVGSPDLQRGQDGMGGVRL